MKKLKGRIRTRKIFRFWYLAILHTLIPVDGFSWQTNQTVTKGGGSRKRINVGTENNYHTTSYVR
jgi:hypothetical protein